MTVARRRFLHLAAGAALLPAAPRSSFAQAYPSRPVQTVVGFPPGSAPDIIARLAAQWLSDRLGQNFVVENRPGAGSNIGTELVVKAQPDGYTILVDVLTNVLNVSLYRNLGFNFMRDVAPVAPIANAPYVFLVTNALPAKTVPEFIAYAKANPGKINFGSGGLGSVQHIAGELFKFMTGVNLVHVPYRGAALVLNDLLAGQVQLTFSPIPLSVGYVRADRLRALAVTGAERSPALPDVPALAEFVPGYEASAVDGIVAPKDTPPAIIDLLNREIGAWLADPATRARLADLGSAPLALSSADFGKLIAADTEKWAKVIKFAGIKAE